MIAIHPDLLARAGQDVDLRLFRKRLPNDIKRPRAKIIIAAQPIDDLSAAGANPLLMALLCPRSFSLTHHAMCGSYRRMISRLPSVDPPSTTMISNSGYF